MSYLIVVFIIALAILIHELGHFLAARQVGIPVAQFSVGFGPKLWSRTYNGVEYRLSALPLGGYVMPAFEHEDDQYKLPLMNRLWFALAGPLANLLSVVVLFGCLNLAKDGFSFAGLLLEPWAQTARTMADFVSVIPRMFTNPGELSGIIGIVAFGGERIAAAGLVSTLKFAIMMNINLCILNLLPFPPLDGGKIVLALLERVHPLAIRLQFPLAVAGMLLLAMLMLYVTAQDIGRLVTG